LTDFNIAVRFREDKPLTAVAGSMAYMAPEILSKKGYFSSIDWWSLGIIVYEMATAKRPFRAKTNEGLTNAILHEEIPLEPLVKCSEEMIDLIKQFLERDVKKRLGVKEMGGYEVLKKHALFRKLDWEVVEAKKAIPPFIPDV
jgi:serine/threonine kinase 32